MTTLFIIHSAKDRGWALELHAKLTGEWKNEGVFLDGHPDDGLEVGDKWESELARSCGEATG